MAGQNSDILIIGAGHNALVCAYYLAELRLQGCSSVQGYLFSRPVTAPAVLEALAAANPERDVA